MSDTTLDLESFNTPTTTFSHGINPQSVSTQSVSPSSDGYNHNTGVPSPGGNILPGLTLQSSAGTKRPSESRQTSPTESDKLVKRQRNNLAAKKYRQKKVDRIRELEDEVEEVKRERDALRIQLARQEAETAALREMLKMKGSS